MILLIPIETIPSSSFSLFKFHYDSINSKKQHIIEETKKEFKFHYDSINSRRQYYEHKEKSRI